MSTTLGTGAAGHGPAVGEPLPDLVLRSLGGDQFALREYLGKRLLLFFWASW